MIWGVLARRREMAAESPFGVSRMAAAVVHAAARTFSNADVSLLGLTAARRMTPQPGRADVSLLGLTAARRMTPQTATAAPSLVGLVAARKMNEPATPTLVSRMSVAVVHAA